MARSITALAATLGFVACRTEPIHDAVDAAPSVVAPIASATAPGQAFGQPIDGATPFVALSTVLASPKAWNGKRVRTRGEIIAVCQAAGCWADLRPEGTPANTKALPTHVTMHDHSFLLPKTSKTKIAEVDGLITVRALTQEECDHFNGEGASLVAGTPIVNVDALGVVLR